MENVYLLLVFAGIAGAIARVSYVWSCSNEEFNFWKEALQGFVVGVIAFIALSNKEPVLNAIMVGAVGGFVGFDLMRKLAESLFNIKKERSYKKNEELAKEDLNDLKSTKKFLEEVKKYKDQ